MSEKVQDKQKTYAYVICIVFAVAIWFFAVISLFNGKMAYEFNTTLFCGAFCLVPAAFYRFRIMRLPLWFVFIIEMAIFIHAFGVALLFFDTIIYYDTLAHSFSSFVIALCASLTLMTVQRYNPRISFSVNMTTVFMFFVMMSFGIIWEAFESFTDLLTGTKMQYCVSDTFRDMFSNALGAVIGALFIKYMFRKISPDEFIDNIDIHPYLRKFVGSKK